MKNDEVTKQKELSSDEKFLISRGNDYLLMQGIDLMFSGMTMIKEIGDLPDSYSFDALGVLSDRLDIFAYCVFTKQDVASLMIDKFKDQFSNVTTYNSDASKEVQFRLENIRGEIQHHKYKREKQAA